MIREMVSKIRWLGHDGFLIKAGDKNIVIDPYELESAVEADILLISHDHFDHCSVDDAAKVVKPGTVIVTEKDSAAKLSGDVRVVAPGDVVEIGDVTVTAVPAYNTNKDFHPKGNGWLGFVITYNGVRIYHAGDTDFIPEMEALDVDIALLPVSGTYVMTWDEAVEAAKKIMPQIAIPMHYGGIVGTSEDADKFKAALDGVCEVVVLEK
ncbi:L-ascorbate metabolism protein UlaG, beta-lactamase superfamily [Desulfatibacillum alkenivorans DSM 16219]|jgi:L-ascorbate metabolism protein UlaG (beta-lactamase superfamily)|uniref:L-ascorbate metabolism protein UlaG, beta-lactamase superfamily n=1 Tax=Desulfatibacillum alkenivorans DSM 16219 TaxID=1121393 RepID=A0A1M6II33_9BACT|nr:MBL fold metallo-hydrolase [Desulfatibacillum alkenivorans]SHJ34063.1 L-ascorbate metabolism protein UlaG, beta-lactamase superfamily [Desulfatibacillum alkenivorans DSM 16219]